LIARTSDGTVVEGETNIDRRYLREDFRVSDQITRIYFNAQATANPDVLQAIARADKIVISSGDLYTSVLPHLLVDGIQEAIAASTATLFFVLNLMTKPGETDGYRASDFLRAFAFYLNSDRRLNYLIANEPGFEGGVEEVYRAQGQQPVEVDAETCVEVSPGVTIVCRPLARYLRKAHLLRHDPLLLAETILELG
jgi:uncharacterized cofD-like protein